MRNLDGSEKAVLGSFGSKGRTPFNARWISRPSPVWMTKGILVLVVGMGAVNRWHVVPCEIVDGLHVTIDMIDLPRR